MVIGHHTVLGHHVVQVAMKELGHVTDLAPIHSLHMEGIPVLAMPFKQNSAMNYHVRYVVQVSIRSFDVTMY